MPSSPSTTEASPGCPLELVTSAGCNPSSLGLALAPRMIWCLGEYLLGAMFTTPRHPPFSSNGDRVFCACASTPVIPGLTCPGLLGLTGKQNLWVRLRTRRRLPPPSLLRFPGDFVDPTKAPPNASGHIVDSTKAPPSFSGHFVDPTKAPPNASGHIVDPTKAAPSVSGHIVDAAKAPPKASGHVVNPTKAPQNASRHIVDLTVEPRSVRGHFVGPTTAIAEGPGAFGGFRNA